MESSFFEYRDKSGVESDSDTEIIDNSVLDESFVPKTPGKKNQTVFVPESDDSGTGGDSFVHLLHNHLNYLVCLIQNYVLTFIYGVVSKRLLIFKITWLTVIKLVILKNS